MSYCTDAIRIVILCGLAGAAALHIAVMVVPNWWHFDYGYWVQDTSGVSRLNGGLFTVCQFDRRPMGAEWTCSPYGSTPGGLKDTTDGLQPPSDLLPLAQGFVVTTLLLSLPSFVLVCLAFRAVERKRLLTMIAFGLMLLQSLLMVAGVGVAHEWIIQPSCIDCDWRELYTYQWCFYGACALIAMYMVAALLDLGVLFLDKRELLLAAQRKGEEDSDEETETSMGGRQHSSVEYGA